MRRIVMPGQSKQVDDFIRSEFSRDKGTKKSLEAFEDFSKKFLPFKNQMTALSTSLRENRLPSSGFVNNMSETLSSVRHDFLNKRTELVQVETFLKKVTDLLDFDTKNKDILIEELSKKLGPDVARHVVEHAKEHYELVKEMRQTDYTPGNLDSRIRINAPTAKETKQATPTAPKTGHDPFADLMGEAKRHGILPSFDKQKGTAKRGEREENQGPAVHKGPPKHDKPGKG